MKNVNANEFNVRILRVPIGGGGGGGGGVGGGGYLQHTLPGGSTFDVSVYEPQSHRLTPISSAYGVGGYHGHNLAQTSSINPSDFVQGILNNLKTNPYRHVRNPYAALNTGENPHYHSFYDHSHHHHRRSPKSGGNYRKRNVNGAAYNSTTIY